MSAMAVSREFVSSSLLKLALLNQKAEASIGALLGREELMGSKGPASDRGSHDSTNWADRNSMDGPAEGKKSDKLHHPKTTQGTITLF